MSEDGRVSGEPPRQRLGVLVAGSLGEGLAARLDPGTHVEQVRLGTFVKVVGDRYEYFCLISDVELEAANAEVLRDPPGGASEVDAFLREALSGTTTYGTVKLKPELMLPRLSAVSGQGPDEWPGVGDQESDGAARPPTSDHGTPATDDAPRPARTVPPHFSGVSTATRADFERVFGAEDRDHFQIGQPLDMDVPVCVNLPRLVQRSNGVFGKSGTGKSFLTRLLLCGVIQSNAAVNLIFDMHSEYGWSATNERNAEVKGLGQLFRGRVLVYTLDPESARTRNVRPDGTIKIALSEITVEDILLLQDELSLHRTAVESAALCEEILGRDWARQLLDLGGPALADFAQEHGGNFASLSALRSKLRLLERQPFVERSLPTSPLNELVASLEAGKHVVLEFGRQKSLLAYILVANVITRRLHDRWVKKTEQYLSTQQASDRPPQLMITIEEAHKFLNAEAARQTTFGTIARELRKFYVTLLVVDQRPSGIDAEVLSQIGTRITCQLNDERDIDAIFTGVSGGSHLRTVLATLDSREQALVLGHAVPMPVLIRTRTYDETFYAQISPAHARHTVATPAERYTQIFGSDG